MILLADEILREVQDGNITISPFDIHCLKPSSYKYHISNTLLEIEEIGDIKIPTKTKEIQIPKEGITLEPHKLYLGTTQEIIGSKKYVTSLIGKASAGNLGMFLQITADLGQIGKAHQWTLEIHVVQYLKIYPNMEVGQVTFWLPKGDVNSETVEFYSTQNTPQISKLYEEIQK